MYYCGMLFNMRIIFQKKKARHYGFTLIEILLVLSLLAIFASIVIVAINPSKHLSESRDAQRETGVYTIVQSLYQYASEHGGSFPEVLDEQSRQICITGSEDCSGLIDLFELSQDQAYLVGIPVDPLCTGTSQTCVINGSGYTATLTANGRVTVEALHAENYPVSVTQ